MTKETERVEDYEECGVGELLARMRQEKHRLSDEAVGAGNKRGSARLEKEMSELRDQWGGALSTMPIQAATDLLISHLMGIEALSAHTEWGVDRAVLIVKGLQGALAYVAAHLESSAEGAADEGAAPANEPTPTGAPTGAPTEGTTIPSWDEAETMVAKAHEAHEAHADDDDDDDDDDDEDDDDGDEGGFSAPAVREIVAAYRHTAMSQRDLLLARLRQACARLGAESACFASWDPNEQGLNAKLGQFQARAFFCLKGICPLDAQSWLEGNVGELEGLHARNRQEYDQAGLVLSGLSDRLFGLLYDLARER